MMSAIYGQKKRFPAQVNLKKWTFPLLGLSLALSACGQKQETRNELDRIVERESLYRDLAGLEMGLADGALAGLSAIDEIRTDKVYRRPFAISPAQFEVSRNRRALAFEQLAGLTAPLSTANDHSDFWEIHQAYRNAVETGLSGHGKIGLVYSRPYPADHLSNPMVALTDAIEGKSGRIAPGDDQVFLQGFRYTTRRLDLSLAAGFQPPPASVQRMLKQVDASPFASAAALDAFKTQIQTPPDETVSVFDPGIQILLTDEILKEVDLYRAVLEKISSTPGAAEETHLTDERFLTASMRQVTSGTFTAETCRGAAQRFSAAVETRLKGLLQASEADLSSAGIWAKRPIDARFEAWLARSPLFTPVEDAGEDAATPVTPATPVVPPAIPLSEQFTSLTDALSQLKPEWTILLNRSFPEGNYQETDFIPPKRPNMLQRSVTPRLQTSALPVIAGEGSYSISFNDLSKYPTSLAVIDLMRAHSPGAELARLAKQNREDRPALSRKLPSMDFDLSWPDFILSLMAERGAFETSPRLHAAHLYRLLQVTTEAEIESGLMTGQLNLKEAAALLKSRLNYNSNEISDVLDKLAVEPSLACGWLSGYQKLNSLKVRAQGVLGGKFNVREFNDVILSAGSRPLFVVENEIDSWIARKAGVTTDKTLPE